MFKWDIKLDLQLNCCCKIILHSIYICVYIMKKLAHSHIAGLYNYPAIATLRYTSDADARAAV